MFSMPFILSGGIKILYDVLIWCSFKDIKLNASLPTSATSTSTTAMKATKTADENSNVRLLLDALSLNDDDDAANDVPAIVVK